MSAVDITGFLSARLDEDEAVVRALAKHIAGRWEPWRSKHDMQVLVELRPGRPAPPETDYDVPDDSYDASWIVDWGRVAIWENDAAYGFEHAATARFVARWDPARVLAEIAAKRDHLKMWTEAQERRARALKSADSGSEMARRASVGLRAEANGYSEAVMRIISQDVAAYAYHPEFDVNWLT